MEMMNPNTQPQQQVNGKPKTLRVVTFNVNGVRQLCLNSSTSIPRLMQETLECSILCIQETKLPRSQLTSYAIDWSFLNSRVSHDAFFSFCRKAPSLQAQRIGYSGVATFTDIRIPVLTSQDGLTASGDPTDLPPLVAIPRLAPPHDSILLATLDAEGRSIVTDLGAFVLINVYCPNDPGDDPQRTQYKMAFHDLVTAAVAHLRAQGREIMLVGDLNVAHRPLDHCDPFARPGTTPAGGGNTAAAAEAAFHARPSRQWLTHLLTTHDLVDVYRAHNPTSPGFTCWNTVINARRSDFGTRIDYVLVSQGLAGLVVNADRMPHVFGSDHCPVFVDLKCEGLLAGFWAQGEEGEARGRPPPRGSARRLPEWKGKQGTLAEWAKRTPSPSAAGAAAAVPLNKTIKTVATTAAKKRAGQQLKLSSFFAKPVAAIASSSSSATNSAPSELNADNDALTEPDLSPFLASSSSPNQETAKSAWSAIFTPTPPPTCHHNEPCTSFVVNKSGPTQGRKFWVCARPVGPTAPGGQGGDKSGVGEWRCGFFMWDKQRNQKGASGRGRGGGAVYS